MSRSDHILAHHPHRTSATAGPNNSDLDDAPRRLDRDSSLSGSDDSSSVPHSPQTQKSCADSPGLSTCILRDRLLTAFASFPEDVQLTAQTLNADGTPKRPMNAFMIFARRRRPQVSAANQMMRTGEISKILSKEWTSMNLVSPSTSPVSGAHNRSSLFVAALSPISSTILTRRSTSRTTSIRSTPTMSTGDGRTIPVRSASWMPR